MKVPIPKGAKKQIGSSKDIVKIMKAILMRQDKLRRKKEYFWTIGLSRYDDIEYIELISIGNYTSTAVDPVEVFSIAVAKKCRRIILVHNHPGGLSVPSNDDVLITKKLVQGASVLNMSIYDHVIITEGTKYYSFRDDGIL